MLLFFLYFSCSNSATSRRTIILDLENVTFFFLQQAALWILMRRRHAGCETIWVYGGNPRQGQGGATCSRKPNS